MLPSARLSRRLLGSFTAIGSALALHAAAVAAPARPIPDHASPAALPAAPDAVLKRLPASAEDLTFRGENAQRTIRIQLGRNEAARIGVFQIALLNAVSLLPERSIVKIAVNGTVLTALQAGSPDKPTLLPIRIPPGLLVPGLNTVRFSAALSHRVDCSINATYELWASLDPAKTGFVVPPEAVSAVRSVDDLALEPLAPDGTTRIHAVLGDDPDGSAVERMAGVIETLVRRAGLVRPVVDVGQERGTGPGFDVMTADAAAALPNTTILARGSGLTIARDAANRLVVGVDAGDLSADRVPYGGPNASRAFDGPIQQGFRASFAQLGLPTEIFAGRHYTASLDVNLPPDFLASNDRAQLLLDGSHAGSLSEGSGLVFRVNGTLVSSLPLVAGRAERFQHAIVELPLRFFHPGHNDLSIEGTTPIAADAQCDTLTMTREPRLTIAGTSELDFPSFAHLLTVPQIPAALAAAARGQESTTHLYLADHDRAAVGAGLTLLANLAATQERIGTPQVHLGGFGENDPPGLVVAATADLPEQLAAAVGRLAAPADDASAPPTMARSDTAAVDSAAEMDPAGAETGPAPGLPDRVEGAASSFTASLQAILRDHGFFFAGDAKSDGLPVAAGSLMIAAVPPTIVGPTAAGVTLPQVLRNPAHWLVVTAADKDTTTTALAQFVASGRWSALAGQAASFDPKSGALHVLQPRSVSYVLPDRFVPSDLRPILGGVMSANIALSVGVLLALMAVLGSATYLVIRRTGVR